MRPQPGSLAESTTVDTALTGEVSSVHFLGSLIRTRMNVAGNTISFDMFNNPRRLPPVVGGRVIVRFKASMYCLNLFDDLTRFFVWLRSRKNAE
ncbi:TOBE domain-containing protein [Agrobacterium rhizogenes]|nr:TOBE domain-containing protein [Rhizobium rhizogenes]NTJ81341.1 TOBE domain-containing protein [Rhizobium rhizogenes]